MKRFDALSETEVLALAISNEEEDSRIYADFAHSLREEYPSTATMFADMAAEESEHRRRLIDLFTERFGDHIPLIRRQDVRGNLERKRHWQISVEAVRKHAAQVERDAEQFYRLAAGRTSDVHVRKLLGDLADTEANHERRAVDAQDHRLTADKRGEEDHDAGRRFVLQIIQPGLVGLMDGSVSTLAPVFAAAFATHNSWNAFQGGTSMRWP